MLKRKEWSKKYRISDRTVFDLFSEFSGMIMISKVHTKSTKYDKIKEVLPSEVNDKMSKKLKPSSKKHPYTFD
jgi:hypothetical protein